MVEKTTVDLGLIEPVLAEYKDTPGSLIAMQLGDRVPLCHDRSTFAR